MSATDPTRPGPSLPGRPKMLNHLAYVTHDIERTVDFYERILGMPMVSTVLGDTVPSTGDDFPFFHVFFRLGDGSTLAFFEAPGLPPSAPRGHPAYGVFEHLAFEVENIERVHAWRDWLVFNDIPVIGPTDHEIVYSIYFHDPVNNIRLELTTPMVENWNDKIPEAQQDLANWIRVKHTAAQQNQDVSEALVKFIQSDSDSHGQTPA